MTSASTLGTLNLAVHWTSWVLVENILVWAPLQSSDPTDLGWGLDFLNPEVIWVVCPGLSFLAQWSL